MRRQSDYGRQNGSRDREARCDLRHGFTLLEMMLVISVSALLIVTISVLMTSLLQVGRQVMGNGQHLMMSRQLTNQFRQDVQKASRFARTDNTLELTTTDGRTIQYSSEGNVVIRQIRDGEKTTFRDGFETPDTALIRFRQEAIGEHTMILLQVMATHGLDDNVDDVDEDSMDPNELTTPADAKCLLEVVAQVGRHAPATEEATRGDKP